MKISFRHIAGAAGTVLLTIVTQAATAALAKRLGPKRGG